MGCENPESWELIPSPYECDWNWLIDVVKKIREIINTELSIEKYHIKQGYSQTLNPYDYDFESIYKSSIEFIKWYNEQNN